MHVSFLPAATNTVVPFSSFPAPSTHRRHHAANQRRVRTAAAAFIFSCQRRAWLSWRAHMQRSATEADQLQRAVNLWAGNTLAQAWHRWRAWAAVAKQHRAVSGAVAQHHRTQLQHLALLALWHNVAERRTERELEYRTVGHMNGFRLDV